VEKCCEIAEMSYNPNWTFKKRKEHSVTKTKNDIQNFVENERKLNDYNLFGNNCYHVTKAIMEYVKSG